MRPVSCSIWQDSSKLTFTNSNYFVTVGSFTADGGLLSPTECVKTTPQMTRFRDAKVCNNLATDEIDDHLTTNAQLDYKIQKERTLYLAVATLRTSPERRWTPLTTPTSSHVSIFRFRGSGGVTSPDACLMRGLLLLMLTSFLD